MSSDKEESNDTDYEDYDLITLKAKGEGEGDEEEKEPFLIDYTNPNNSFIFVNVQDFSYTSGSQIFSCYGSRTN